jgi:hypothetical protein
MMAFARVGGGRTGKSERLIGTSVAAVTLALLNDGLGFRPTVG